MFFPVFDLTIKSGASSVLNLKPGGFEAGCIAVLLLERHELEAADILLENGIPAEPETEPSVDLTPYGFQRKLYRCPVYLNRDRIAELEGIARSYRHPALESLAESIKNSAQPKEFELFGKRYSPESPLIMGVINLTDDSFYERSRHADVASAVKKAEEMVQAGADIVDIGGQSTRPGSKEIPLEEELKRVIPAVREISEKLGVPVSVDTSRREVAEEALSSGASMINDVYGLRRPGMLDLAVSSRVPFVVMHMKGASPETMQENPHYFDVISEVSAFFGEVVFRFEERGGDRKNLILDPGIGFGKRYEDNLTLIANLNALSSSGLPLLIGHSRKSFIGIALDGAPPEDRLYGSISVAAISVFKGASILRVHDVKETRDAAKVAAQLRKHCLNA